MDEPKRPPLPLLILGARSFAREVADLLSEIPTYELKGFVENLERDRCEEKIDGLPVHWVDEMEALAATHLGICAFGSTKRLAFIQEAQRHGMRFATLIHPTSRVSARSSVDEGGIVSPGVHIASQTTIGSHVLINRGALIGHNVETGNCVTIGPGANIAGFCRIGSGCYIGMGAVIVERTIIGSSSVVAAGSVVTRDVPDHVMVAGMPARVIKHDVDGL